MSSDRVSRRKVLIIDDDGEIAPLYAASLAKADFETEIITDSSDALVRLAQSAPDLILLDINMPVVSGQDILAYIADRKHLADTHVIVVTGASHLIEDYIRERANLLLLKPVNVLELRALAVRMTAPDE